MTEFPWRGGIINIPGSIREKEAEEIKKRFLEAKHHPSHFIQPYIEPEVTLLTDPMRKFLSDADIENRIAHHPPSSPAIVEAHEEIRRSFSALAVRLNNLLPEGPLKTTAINNLIRAMQDANTCVAVEQKLYGWPEPMDGRPQDGVSDQPQADEKPVIDLGEAKLKCEQCGVPVVDGKHAYPYEHLDNNHAPVL